MAYQQQPSAGHQQNVQPYGAPPAGYQQPGSAHGVQQHGAAPVHQQGSSAPHGQYGAPPVASTTPQPYVTPQAYSHGPQTHCFLGEQFVVQGQQPLLLVLTEKKLSLGSDSTVTDQNGGLLFKFDGKALSLKDKRVLRDKNNIIVATMQQKLFGKHTWVVSRGNGGAEVCSVQQDDANAIGTANVYVGGKKKLGAATADYTVRVQASGKDFQLTSQAGQLLAETSKQTTKVGGILNADRYGVVVQPGVDMAWVLMLVTALDDMVFKK